MGSETGPTPTTCAVAIRFTEGTTALNCSNSTDTAHNGAIDVYWFLRPLDRDKELVLPEPGNLSKPLITCKPKCDYLGCCLCVKCVIQCSC